MRISWKAAKRYCGSFERRAPTEAALGRGESMYRIGVISDTHGLLRPEVKEILRGCEAILHGGDIDRADILEELGEIAPIYAVRGNNDGAWAEWIPETLAVSLFGISVFMVHNKKMLSSDIGNADLVICGHSHRYEEGDFGGGFFLNPGSCGPRRFALPLTMALVETHGDGPFQVRRIQIGLLDSKTQRDGQIGAGDMRRIVRKVMRDVDRGAAVEKIAARNHISSRLAEQICRLYLTHPGVDEEGILKKMGL